MKRTLIAVIALVLAACGGDSSGPSIPAKTNISGTWSGVATGLSGAASTITVTVLHDTISNNISGSGSFVQGTASVVLAAQGLFTNPGVTLTLNSQGFQPMNFTGTHSGQTISGTVSGSGFTNAALTLTKR